MAPALPVVATRVGGNVELVEDGETGLLVQVRQPEALVRALDCYLGDPAIARKHGAAARARAEREFGLERMLTGYCDLYRSLVGEWRWACPSCVVAYTCSITRRPSAAGTAT